MVGVPVESLGGRIDADGAERLLVHSPSCEDGDLIVITHMPNAMDGLRVEGAVAPAVAKTADATRRRCRQGRPCDDPAHATSRRSDRAVRPSQGRGQSADGHHDHERGLCAGPAQCAVLPHLRAGDRSGAGGLERGQRRGHRGRHHQSAGAAAAHRRQPGQDDLHLQPGHLGHHDGVQGGHRPAAGAGPGAPLRRRVPQLPAGRREARGVAADPLRAGGAAGDHRPGRPGRDARLARASRPNCSTRAWTRSRSRACRTRRSASRWTTSSSSNSELGLQDIGQRVATSAATCRPGPSAAARARASCAAWTSAAMRWSSPTCRCAPTTTCASTWATSPRSSAARATTPSASRSTASRRWRSSCSARSRATRWKRRAIWPVARRDPPDAAAGRRDRGLRRLLGAGARPHHAAGAQRPRRPGAGGADPVSVPDRAGRVLGRLGHSRSPSPRRCSSCISPAAAST
jgi:hypothetical protein